MYLRFGVTLFPVLPGEQAAHGSPSSAKPAAGMKPPALETAEGLGSSPLPACVSSKCIPCPGAKGEMHLWEASHSAGAGEKHGLSVGLQRCLAGGLLLKGRLRGAGAEPCKPRHCQPRCEHSPGQRVLGMWGQASGAGITSSLCHAQNELPRKLSEMAAGKHAGEIPLPVLPLAQLQPRPSGRVRRLRP